VRRSPRAAAARRRRPLHRLAAGALALAGCGGSSKGGSATTTQQPASTSATTQTAPAAPRPSLTGPGTVTAAAGTLTATMHPSTHHPRVGRPWPIRFSVQRGGRPVAASVSYQYLLGGQVVARRSHYTFQGRFSDVFMWPDSAIGFPLTFRAVIVSGGTTINLDYAVQVIR
jgi:hypothetical protein